MNDIQRLIDQLLEPFLLLGDFDAHNTLLGSLRTDAHGKTIEDLINENILHIFNDGRPTYCSPATGTESCLDLWLGSSSWISDFSWNQIDNTLCSDHYPIEHIGPVSYTPIAGPTRWRLGKADCLLFESTFRIRPEEIEGASVDALCSIITKQLFDAAIKAITSLERTFA